MAADEAAYEAAVAAFLAVSEDCHLSLVNCGKPDLVAELGRLACRTNFAPLWSCPTYLTLMPEEEADEEGADEEEEELDEPSDAVEQGAEEEEEEIDEPYDAEEQDAEGNMENGRNMENEGEGEEEEEEAAEGMDPEVWFGKGPLLPDATNRNLVPALQKPRRPRQKSHAAAMLQAAIADDRLCRACRRRDGITMDHVRPLAVDPCPAIAAGSKAARIKLAREGKLLKLLCHPCHLDKTNADTKLFSQIAATSLVLFMFPLDENRPFTVAELRRQFSYKQMQRILKKAWHADRLKEGVSKKIYDIGENGMPRFRCQHPECDAITQSTEYAWAQHNRAYYCETRELATILKPKCRLCKRATFPIVCCRTELPHYSTWSIRDLLKQLENLAIAFLQPESAAQVRSWREKGANGGVWFEWPR
jgi:hypothetical protein